MATAKKINFTKAYEELEQIVADFESRELDLEKDIPRFERGMELAQQLKQRLREIENVVTEVTHKFAAEDEPTNTDLNS